MGILVRSQSTGKNIYMLKGAEVVIEAKIRPTCRVSMEEHCENLANEGLRTLVFAQKLLTDEETDEFLEELKKAQTKVFNREKSVMQVLQKLEKDMDFLGVTGVEDRLQNNV